MEIVALDIATNTGVAAGSAGRSPLCWSVDLGSSKLNRKMTDAEKSLLDDKRFSNILRLTNALIEKHKPEMIVCEAFIGGRDASAYLIGLVACVRGCAANRGVRIEMVYPATVRKHFLGKALTSKDFPHLSKAKGKIAIKEKVAERCRLLGWTVPDLDAADAAATWDWGQSTLGKSYQAAPLGGLFNG